jgi:hypothetical protein
MPGSFRVTGLPTILLTLVLIIVAYRFAVVKMSSVP